MPSVAHWNVLGSSSKSPGPIGAPALSLVVSAAWALARAGLAKSPVKERLYIYSASGAMWPLLKLLTSAVVERKWVMFQQNFHQIMCLANLDLSHSLKDR